MKLSIVNGSPRGKGSNTKLLLDKFLEGFASVEHNLELNQVYLKTEKDPPKLQEVFSYSDIMIIAFPLYTDAMPGIVKKYFEDLAALRGTNPGLRLGFIVQSGFPESYHSVHISRYLEKLAERLEVHYLGTAIRGGIEGIKVQPKWMTRKTFDLFYELGQCLALEWEFNQKVLEQLGKPKHLKGFRLMNYKFLRKTGLANYFWNMQLRENNAYGRRFAKPYLNN